MKREPGMRTIPIPVKVSGGTLQFLHGGEVPKIKDGSVGTLTFSEFQFENQQEAERLLRTETVTILQAGETLYVHLAPKNHASVPEGLEQIQATNMFWGSGGFAQVVLMQDLQLSFSGTRIAKLSPCKCRYLKKSKEAGSINEVYTRLSEIFEPHRKSHTGNVFEKVFFLPEGKTWWQPLDDLRTKHEVAFVAKVFPNSRT